MTRSGNAKSSALIWVCALFVVSFFVWAGLTEIDELVRADGKVIPSQQLQIVQNLEGGIVSDILVSEGDFVDSGQVLLKMDATQVDSSFNEQRLRVLELEAQAARLRAEVAGTDMPNQFDIGSSDSLEFKRLFAEEISLYRQRQAELASSRQVIAQQIAQKQQSIAQAQAQLEQTNKALKLAQKEIDILGPLLKEGVVSEVEMLRAEKALLAVEKDQNQYRFAIPEYQAAVEELESKLRRVELKFRAEAQQALNQILAELPRLGQGSDALKDIVKRTLMRSPVRGTVKQLMINTIGGVIRPGMDVVSIVPMEDRLLVEAKVRPSDIARLYPGQRARVKFTAYDFASYGGLDAQLKHISADTLLDDQGNAYFLVRVETDSNTLTFKGEDLPIIPGMVAQIDILTGKKTILDYLVKPVLRMQANALTEP